QPIRVMGRRCQGRSQRMWQLISRCQGARATLALVTVATCASCGGDAPPADATHKTQHSGNSPSTPVETPPLPPVAAISAPQTALVTPATAPDGSAEAALQKIAELIVTANAQARQA